MNTPGNQPDHRTSHTLLGLMPSRGAGHVGANHLADRPNGKNVRVDDEPARLPIRVVVSDDLERSRVTVLFRIILAIPHLVVVALWGIAAGAVSIVVWLALLFEGKAPRTLQSFVISYLRYSVQVSAYVHLAAGPYPQFGGGDGYPVDLEVEPSERQSRGRVAARIVLAFPSLLLAGALGGGSWFWDVSWLTSRDSGRGWSAGWSVGGIAATAAFLAWFASLARGRTPRGLRDLTAYGIAYIAQSVGYLLLVTDRYPTSDPVRVQPLAELPRHPVRLELTDQIERSRLTVFFRLLLAIPHLLWLSLWSMFVLLAVVVAWFVALATGRVPSALHRFIGAWVRYAMHVGAFLFLVGGPFPGFVGAAGSYPVDVAIDPPQRQHRAVTLFRVWLVFPALILGGAYTAVVWLVALLGWWAALFTGRMPEGMRNLGAVSLRYTAQVNAYLFLLTDQYPYSAPAVRDRPRHEQLELELPVDGLAGIEPA
jgi:hypothetical protein